MRRAVIVAVGVAVLGLLAGCGGSSMDVGSSTSTTKKATTAQGAAGASTSETTEAWVLKWKPLLSTDYGTAQKLFLAAIQTGQAPQVQAAAEGLAASNQRLSAAISDAGPPPKAVAATVERLTTGLSTEAELLAKILQTCTDANKTCQNAVTSYAKNNTKQVIPALTDLGI